MLRLYSDEHLSENVIIPLDERSFHHACVVMRLKEKDHFLLFNEQNGEFEGKIYEKQKKSATVHLQKKIKEPQPSKPLHLVFAPLKPERMSFLIEKATELGVTHFHPVSMKHGQYQKINLDKWNDYALQAVQQSERFTLPVFESLQAFSQVIESSQRYESFVARERSSSSKILRDSFKNITKETMLIVGPEGGFAEDEKRMLESQGHIHKITLGDFILRAETAAIYMISVYREHCL